MSITLQTSGQSSWTPVQTKPVTPSADATSSTASVSAAAEAPAPSKPVSSIDFSASIASQKQNLQQALDQLNEEAAKSNQSVSFSLDKCTDEHVVTVTNSQTGDVILQFPTEKMLQVAASLQSSKGIFCNQKT